MTAFHLAWWTFPSFWTSLLGFHLLALVAGLGLFLLLLELFLFLLLDILLLLSYIHIENTHPEGVNSNIKVDSDISHNKNTKQRIAIMNAFNVGNLS